MDLHTSHTLGYVGNCTPILKRGICFHKYRIKEGKDQGKKCHVETMRYSETNDD